MAIASSIKAIKPLGQWLAALEDTTGPLRRKLDQTYGGDSQQAAQAADSCRATLKAFAEAYGSNEKVIVARSTGRVNVLGTHIDHRGGSVNPIAIKELWIVAQPRNDDLVVARNVESDKFPQEQFHISENLPCGKKIGNWDAWCYSEFDKRTDDKSITWSSYVRAMVLYLQHLNTRADGTFDPPLRGMNAMFYGRVPQEAGLSSSSAVLVATAKATMCINGIQMEPLELVEHCGLAEWYVGTRGGCGDHAAIVFGKPNALLHITAYPMTVDDAPLEKGYRFVVANSLVKAQKQVGARHIFNNRVAAYQFGLMLIRKNFPQYADKLHHLRDVDCETLGVDQAEIYRIVMSLPQSAFRVDLLKRLSEHSEELNHIFRSHEEPRHGYLIRQVCLYGITECLRANLVPKCLRSGDMVRLGQLMSISHDGDRITKWTNDCQTRLDTSYPDDRLAKLIKLSAGPDSDDGPASLWRQPGAYRVSVPELDHLADIACATSGVLGAGLVGAGIGGSLVVLVAERNAQQVIDNMAQQYYNPRSLPVKAEIVSPVGGASVIDF